MQLQFVAKQLLEKFQFFNIGNKHFISVHRLQKRKLQLSHKNVDALQILLKST